MVMTTTMTMVDNDNDDDDDDDFRDRIINVQVRSEVSRATNCCLSARTQSGKTLPMSVIVIVLVNGIFFSHIF